jgi:hypothetical protein
MNGKFKLEIELGNAAMHTHSQLVRALREHIDCTSLRRGEGSIFDINGNKVGEWSFEKEK